MSHRQIQTLQRSHLKCMSFHKTKPKGYSLKQTDLNIIFFMCILFSWGKTLHQNAKSCVCTGRADECFVSCAQGCRVWPFVNMHQNKKYVHCSTSCLPFLRLENKRVAEVFSSGDLQEHCSALKEAVHDTCSG